MKFPSDNSYHPPGLPTATVEDYRYPLWQIGKQASAPRHQTTVWGGVKVEQGNPTSLHRDILDAIFTVAEQSPLTPSGEMYIAFDAAKVLRLLGTRADYRWLLRKLREINQIVISIRPPKIQEWPAARQIVTYAGESSLAADRHAWQYKANLKKLVLPPAAVQAMELGIQIRLDDSILRTLLSLKHAASRSLARWCLSHVTRQKHLLDTLLKAIGVCNVGERQRRGYAAQIHEDAIGLAKIGVRIDGPYVLYKRPPHKVWFSKPKKEQKYAVSEAIYAASAVICAVPKDIH